MKRVTSRSNNEKIMISTIIPVYNAEKYLERTLDSVLNQENMRNIEVICVDDCSSDNSLNILRAYSEKDSRVKIVSNTTNVSAGACRNVGISMAKGQYVHFLDADDWLEPNAYISMYNCITKAKADICICLYNKYDNVTGEVTAPQFFSYDTGTTCTYEGHSKYFFNTSVVPWNKLYRAEFIKSNNIVFDSIICANDRTFYFDSITKASNIVFIKEQLINYRINNAESLVGQARVNHYDCHFKAFISSREKIFNSLNEEAKKLFIQTSIVDIISFYHKESFNEKMCIDICNFIKDFSEDIEYAVDLLRKHAIYAEIQLLRTLSIENINSMIPVVFATNNNYAPYMSVAIQSLISQASSSNKYHLYILYSDLDERYFNPILNMSTSNVEITFLDVNGKIEYEIQNLYSRAHYSKEMYYRILIPDIFRPYKKVLYLDCDIVVRKDVAELYNIDIEDNYLGGIINISSEQMCKYIKNQLHLPVNNYINSGILIINCNEFRDNYIKEKCFDLVRKNSSYVCPDQDILNLVCYQHIYYLDMKWNFQWGYSINDPAREDLIKIDNELLEKYLIAEKNHAILHFTSGIKAWNSPERKNAFIFWEYAKSNPFFVEILCKNTQKILSFAINNKQITSLRKDYMELSNRLNWNREERKRLIEENKSLLTVISLASGNDDKKNAKKATKVVTREILPEDECYYQLSEIRKSFSYKLGMFLTWIPRKLRALFRR